MTAPWLIALVFGNKFYTSFSYFCDWNTESFHEGFVPISAIFVAEILKAFTEALLQHLVKLGPKTTSCKAWNKFKALCLLFFITFLFLHQKIALQKLWTMFFISSKNSFCSHDIWFFVIFSLPFQTFQIQMDKWKWNDLWCHELPCMN